MLGFMVHPHNVRRLQITWTLGTARSTPRVLYYWLGAPLSYRIPNRGSPQYEGDRLPVTSSAAVVTTVTIIKTLTPVF